MRISDIPLHTVVVIPDPTELADLRIKADFVSLYGTNKKLAEQNILNELRSILEIQKSLTLRAEILLGNLEQKKADNLR